jgi:hypothetical protein
MILSQHNQWYHVSTLIRLGLGTNDLKRQLRSAYAIETSETLHSPLAKLKGVFDGKLSVLSIMSSKRQLIIELRSHAAIKAPSHRK